MLFITRKLHIVECAVTGILLSDIQCLIYCLGIVKTASVFEFFWRRAGK